VWYIANIYSAVEALAIDKKLSFKAEVAPDLSRCGPPA
jgi:hypothetical protein